MPIVEGKWVPPSSIIAEIGLQTYLDQFSNLDNKYEEKMAIKARKTPKKEEAPSAPLDAREGFTFGADPELFVFKDDRPVSAEGLIPGTKAKPHEVKDGIFVQVDGMAAEFNIPPVSTFKDFNRCVESAIKQLEEMLPDGYDLRAVPTVTFSEEDFNAASDTAKELGCSPDYNAWTGMVNPPPKNAANPFLRTASGHLHLGWTKGASLADRQHVMNCCDLVKQFDWFLGAWSIKLDPDPSRRDLYGRAGACRFKPYGVEYRVLSNFWVTSRERRLAVWNRMQSAIDAMSKIFYPEKSFQFNELIQQSINGSELDSTLARHYGYPILSLEPPSIRF